MEVFDYGSISEEQKKAIQEVIDLARQSNNEMFAQFLTHKFKIVEPVRIDHTNTQFYKMCSDNDIKVWLMGWVQDGGGEDPSAPHWPVVSITEDVRKIEKLLKHIKESE